MTDPPGDRPADGIGCPDHGTGHDPGGGPVVAPTRPEGRQTPVVLLTSGLTVAALAAVILSLGLAGTIRAATPLATVPDGGSAVTSLEAGTDYGIFGSDSSTCTVTGPDGVGIPIQDPAVLAAIPNHNLIGFFTPGAEGEHTVTCSASLPARPTTVDLLARANTGLKASSAILFGVLGLVAGLSLALAGLIRRRTRGTQARQHVKNLKGPGGGRGTKGATGPHIVLTCGIALLVLGFAMLIVGLSALELFEGKAHGDLRFAVLEQSFITMMRLGGVATILGALVAVLGASLCLVRAWVSHRAITRAQRTAQQPHVLPAPPVGQLGTAPGQGGPAWPPPSSHPSGYPSTGGPAGGLGAGSTHAPAAPTGPHRHEGPALMLVCSLVVTVVTLIMTLAGFSLLTGLVASTPEVPGDGVPRHVTLEEGTAYWLQADVSWHASPCAVTGPDGAEVPIRKDRAYPFAIGTFTPTTSGRHTITCIVSTPALLGRLDDLDTLIATAAGTAAGSFGLVVGPSLALAGLIRFRMRPSRSRTTAQAALSA